jgi:hypothetical protein
MSRRDPRLATGIWVAAYLKRLEALAISAYVAARGDENAGAVLVKVATLDGRASLYHRSFDLSSGERAWAVLAEGPEAEIDAALTRQRRYDPDLWAIEVEDRAGRHLLGEAGLEA